MPWVKEVPAIVQAWYLGSEAGSAIASVLTGDVNPSGKLPFTFPASLQDVGAHKLGEYPGTPRSDGSPIVDQKYNEGIFVGYRWVDKGKDKTAVLLRSWPELYYFLPTGKAVADKKVMGQDETLTITLPVTNTGCREGSEVIQLYISDLQSSLPCP